MAIHEIDYETFETTSLAENSIGELRRINDPSTRALEAGRLIAAAHVVLSEAINEVKEKLRDDQLD